jgi:apolipoprotein N-acyltransferase
MSRYRLLLILPPLAGLLLSCSFPRISRGYIAWFALIPLLWFVARAGSRWMALLGGFVAGVASWSVLLVWIPRVLVHYGGTSESVAWLLYVLMACFLSCYPAAACFLTRVCMERCGEAYLLSFPFAWVSLEYLRTYVPFGGFPWLLAGYSQTDYPHLIQIADLTGVYGVSFLLVWLNAAAARLALQRFRLRQMWPMAAGLLFTGAAFLYGRAMLQTWGNTVPSASVAMLQGNLSYDQPEAALAGEFQEGYVRMASRLAAGSTDLLVLPESPSPLNYQFDASYREAMKKLARRFPLGLVFNNISYAQEEGRTRYFNSAYFVNQDGTDLGRYDKLHLVPFGEYVPLRKLFFFVDTISKDVSDFSPGHEYLTVQLQGHRVNAIICFEAVFPGLVRRFVERGSTLIINLTNDGWYGDSAAPFQHLAMSRWRAVENRRFLLRAANSGISAIVDPTGALWAPTPLLQQAICEGRIAFLKTQTLYTRYGDLFAILCAIIMVALLINNRRVRSRKA